MQDYQLAMIGFGSMGGAILRGALTANVLPPERVLVIEPDNAKRAHAVALGCVASAHASDALGAEQIMLCTKPQVFPAVADAIGSLPADRIVISIMAGLSSTAIRRALGSHARVIRTMPNTPCLIGHGITAIALGEGAQPGDETLASSVFSAIGAVVALEESHMHAVTAVSGSGPAYAYLLAESMEQAAVQLGLDTRTARTLAYRTVAGAGAMLLHDPHMDAEALRTQVTSPGGTTAAALEEMFERELPQIVVDAIHRARDRGIDLDQ